MGEGSRPSGAWHAGFGLTAVALMALAAPALAEPMAPMVQQAALAVPIDVVPPEVVAPPIHEIVARIDISDQTMNVYLDDVLTNVFAVSTARGGYVTPVGEYAPEWITKFHRSKKYHNSPMPWSVFFHGGYAIHGTTDIRRLGKPASHGCVRLHPDNAKIFFQMVKDFGMENTLITVVR